MGKLLKDAYGKYFKEMLQYSKAPAKIDSTNVYQEANKDLTKYMEMLISDNILPGSGLGNVENFKEFYDAVKAGKRGLILMEHYTNLDLPEIIYFLKIHGEDWSKEFSEKIVAVAGMKLNEAGADIRVWTEGFTRVVIYPTRSLDKVGASGISEEEKLAEEKKARAINLAAMRAMDECKKRGQVVLVFPSGTRYRPGHPETKKGLREIDSYLRLFDIVLPVAINGNCLRINPDNPEDMVADIVEQDKVLLTASKMLDCKTYRKQILDSLPADEPDPKQKTIDGIMDILAKLHDEVEKTRLN
ncbi:MAG: 1-acyl-sn-glycerol-3-phosphate acyltransferase [Treponema sp.]|nr:1-acyl-sn-glycerol-3-phosphate acyltransferase [Treponema sp.]